MSVALAGYFREVASSDVFDYGFGHVADFLKSNHPEGAYDWIITNPPFRLGEDFIGRAMKIARRGWLGRDALHKSKIEKRVHSITGRCNGKLAFQPSSSTIRFEMRACDRLMAPLSRMARRRT